MAKQNMLLYIAELFFITGMIAVGSSKDPKEAQLLQSPHPQRVDQNIGIRIPAITPPLSPRSPRLYEKAVRSFKQQPRNRLNPRR